MARVKNVRALRGMSDIMSPSVGMWQRVESTAREIFSVFRYAEIRTPILEETGLFISSIGEETDIVQKEMFTFTDRGERSVTLRPEGTACIVRAYLEANLNKREPFQKFYYIGPMFRAERPQAGRLRQFHQIGAEAIGSTDPALDAEVITLLARILDEIGITGYTLRLNSLGCKEDKARLSKKLKEALDEKKKLLCDDCKKRLNANPMRTLDCKNESCRTAVRGTMKSITSLCEACEAHFDKVKAYLNDAKVAYQVDPYIVRGLDYYTGTVFEVSHPSLGSQDAIGAGGRYDNLIHDMGGPKLGACGFALGIERMILALGEGAAKGTEAGGLTAYIATIGDQARTKGVEIVKELRSAGVSCDLDYESKSLKAQMRQADSLGAKSVVIIGEDELKSGAAQVRDMATKEQRAVTFSDLVAVLNAKA